jgi:hypothetical protein
MGSASHFGVLGSLLMLGSPSRNASIACLRCSVQTTPHVHHACPVPVQGGKKKSKPAWALTANEAEGLAEAEANEAEVGAVVCGGYLSAQPFSVSPIAGGTLPPTPAFNN